MALESTGSQLHEELARKLDFALDMRRESKQIEFVSSADWQSVSTKIAKTAIAMSNNREGGIIIVGVADSRTSTSLTGVTESSILSYDTEAIREFVAKYSSPIVEINCFLHAKDSKQFIAIVVEPFEETPTIVKKDAPDGVSGSHSFRRGDFLVRTDGKPESRRVLDEREMHAVIEFAAERRSQRLLDVAQRVGLKMPDNSQAAFERERHQIHALSRQFASVPHWTYTITSGIYGKRRISSISDLERNLESCRVFLSPSVFPPDELEFERFGGTDFIGKYIDLEDYSMEFWQYWTSGQFVFIEQTPESKRKDWEQQLKGLLVGHSSTEVPGVIALSSTYRRFIEVFAFARRLTTKAEESVIVSISLANAFGFYLVTDSHALFRLPKRITDSNVVTMEFEFTSLELQSNLRSVVSNVYREIIERWFGWRDLPKDAFESYYDDFTADGVRVR
jgi:hypothetical protein